MAPAASVDPGPDRAGATPPGPGGSVVPLVVLAAGLARRYGGCKPLAPVGPSGEAVIDLVASDAVAAGFGRVVLVLNPESGPAIRYHVERCWPEDVAVAFAVQSAPLGTAHAVLAARPLLEGAHPFAVANADDVYGIPAMATLRRHLDGPVAEHALVGFPLSGSVVSDQPVTRGVCVVDADGLLAGLTERRQVRRGAPGAPFTAHDGGSPSELAGDTPVSLNLWGYQPSIWDALERAVARSETTPGGEVLLPEVVGRMVAEGTDRPVRVLTVTARAVGVTHPGDLDVARAVLARLVATGERPARLWEPVTGQETLAATG
ncbi:MAG: nucleotidyltransferase family protein [Acidimicrobiales bacterium]